jgi:hypothetical protein
MTTSPISLRSRKLNGFYTTDKKSVAAVVDGISDDDILEALRSFPHASFDAADVGIARELLTDVVAYFLYLRDEAPTVGAALDALEDVQRLSAELLTALASDGPAHTKGSRIAQSVWDALEATVGDTHTDFSIKALRSQLRAIANDVRARDHIVSRAAKRATPGSHHDSLLSGVAYRFFLPRQIRQTYSTSWAKAGPKVRRKDTAKRKPAPSTLRFSDVAALTFRLGSLLPEEMRPSSETALIERHKNLIPQWREYLVAKVMRYGASRATAEAVAADILKGRRPSP